MARFFVLPYTQGSEGAKAIADAVGGKRLLLLGSEYRYQEGDCVINWGNGDANTHRVSLGENIDHILNYDVNVCINKKTFFQRMQGHNIVPPFAFGRDEALRHLEFPIICRNRLEGADGVGITVATHPEEVTDCRLYTQLLEKVAEYRVHLGRQFDGSIVLICAQKKRLGVAHATSGRSTDPRIWTGEHVFLDWCDPCDLPRAVFDVTKRSMELMPELHFGGFDVIVTPSWGARVVEVNSAPMQTPTTAERYARFFKEYVSQRDTASAVPEPVIEDTLTRLRRDFYEGRIQLDDLLACYSNNAC